MRGDPRRGGQTGTPLPGRSALSRLARSGARPPVPGERAPGQKAVRIEPSVGSPLAPALRDRIRAASGSDPGDVRIHADDAAARSASALRAAAFTLGRHVFFAAGRFDPGTHAGFRLLVHEMIHVRQQPNGRGFRPAEVTSARLAVLEAEAEGGVAVRPGAGAAAVPMAHAPLSLATSRDSTMVPLTAPLDPAGEATPAGGVPAADGAGEVATAGAGAQQFGLAELAREVYGLIEWRLLAERESEGIQRWLQ